MPEDLSVNRALWDERVGVHRTSASKSVEWQHPVSDVVNAVIDAGLRIESLHEHEYTLYPRWPDLVVSERGYELPAGEPSLPLLWSLSARRPAS